MPSLLMPDLSSVALLGCHDSEPGVPVIILKKEHIILVFG
jgi:hypothetical protein